MTRHRAGHVVTQPSPDSPIDLDALCGDADLVEHLAADDDTPLYDRLAAELAAYRDQARRGTPPGAL